MREAARLTCFLVAVAAVGGGGCGNPANTTPSKAIDACKIIFGSIRSKGAECGSGIDIVFTQTAVDNQCTLIQTYADAGTLKYESSRFSGCKSAIDTSSCGLDDPKV